MLMMMANDLMRFNAFSIVRDCLFLLFTCRNTRIIDLWLTYQSINQSIENKKTETKNGSFTHSLQYNCNIWKKLNSYIYGISY